MLEQAWAQWMRRKEAKGWKLGRVVSIKRIKEPVVNSKGDIVREYEMDIELHRRLIHQIFDIPDEMVSDILKNVPGAKLIE